MSTPHLRNCPKVNCNQKNDCCPFRKIVIPAVMGDDSEDSPSAPENGAYRNALVEYEANGTMYMYASDGIFTKLSMVTGGAGAATISYVDTQDARTLANAKAYADSIVPTVDVTKAYVDQQDAETLAEAKAYTDEHSGGGAQSMYADLTITNFGTTTVYATANKTVTEVINAVNSDEAVLYRIVLPQSIPSLGLDAGTYLFRPDYVGATSVVATPTSWTTTPLAVQLFHDAPTDVVIQFAQVSSFIEETATPIVNSAISQANVPVFTLSNVDISEGSALAANNFYGVYE